MTIEWVVFLNTWPVDEGRLSTTKLVIGSMFCSCDICYYSNLKEVFRIITDTFACKVLSQPTIMAFTWQDKPEIILRLLSKGDQRL